MLIPLDSEYGPPSGSITSWSSVLLSSLETLKLLAGTTEHEFLHIGSELQEVYAHSITLSQTAHELVGTASGAPLQALCNRLREIFTEMNTYLDQASARYIKNFNALQKVAALLKKVGEPLAGVKKMSKHLYILEVSIKIESAYMGDMGSEFANLALDIKKLSQQTKEKTNTIEDHRRHLEMVIAGNREELAEVRGGQDAKAEATFSRTAESLRDMETVSGQFSRLGDAISAYSSECSDNISTVVQSMQFHDIFRQQVEHVIDGLKGLLPDIAADHNLLQAENHKDQQALISRTGDVCELQEAQLQFAASALFEAVSSIVDSLWTISAKQKEMAEIITGQTGSRSKSTNGAASNSFIAEVSRQMHILTGLLVDSGDANKKMAVIMQEVADTVRQITGFVADIDNIGKEITQIALNARIKAASTGKQGAALSVLAEEIGQMSGETVQRTDLITTTLSEVYDTTEVLATEAMASQDKLSTKLFSLEEELTTILINLDAMGEELGTMLSRISDQVELLSAGIERITSQIDVHERTRTMADKVLAELRTIIGKSRSMYPASDSFKEDLRQMAQRYTMESERRVHESIANRHGLKPVVENAQTTAAESAVASEFGDNVDLF